MAGKPGSFIKSGSTEVVTAGTAVQVVPPLKSPNFDRTLVGILVSADSGNTEPVVVGDSTVKAVAKSQNGVVLAKAAAAVFIEIEDAQQLWVDAGTSKDKLSWLAIYR